MKTFNDRASSVRSVDERFKIKLLELQRVPKKNLGVSGTRDVAIVPMATDVSQTNWRAVRT